MTNQPSESGKQVTPLRSRTMTLSQLQMEVLDVLRKVKFQFRRQAHEDGMSDAEFIEQVIDQLATKIYQDRQVLKMHRRNKQKDAQ
jgi:hypothetical protein